MRPHHFSVAKAKQKPQTDTIIKGLSEAVNRDMIAQVRREAYELGKREGFQLAIALVDEEVGECECRMESSMLIICSSCQSEPVLTFLLEMKKHIF
jgi:hypothetical protein